MVLQIVIKIRIFFAGSVLCHHSMLPARGAQPAGDGGLTSDQPPPLSLYDPS